MSDRFGKLIEVFGPPDIGIKMKSGFIFSALVALIGYFVSSAVAGIDSSMASFFRGIFEFIFILWICLFIFWAVWKVVVVAIDVVLHSSVSRIAVGVIFLVFLTTMALEGMKY